MKKIILSALFLLSISTASATIHVIQVWNGYLQFLPNDLTINLGDTVQWLPLDAPTMAHTVTSATIPAGAVPFDVLWQAPADTFFQYIPAVAGVYDYVCTPHITMGMVGKITVLEPTNISESNLSDNALISFPNPATNMLFISPKSIGILYSIVDLNGRTISTGTTKESISIEHLEHGIYFLKLQGDKPRTQRFIKQ